MAVTPTRRCVDRQPVKPTAFFSTPSLVISSSNVRELTECLSQFHDVRRWRKRTPPSHMRRSILHLDIVSTANIRTYCLMRVPCLSRNALSIKNLASVQGVKRRILDRVTINDGTTASFANFQLIATFDKIRLRQPVAPWVARRKVGGS